MPQIRRIPHLNHPLTIHLPGPALVGILTAADVQNNIDAYQLLVNGGGGNGGANGAVNVVFLSDGELEALDGLGDLRLILEMVWRVGAAVNGFVEGYLRLVGEFREMREVVERMGEERERMGDERERMGGEGERARGMVGGLERVVGVLKGEIGGLMEELAREVASRRELEGIRDAMRDELMREVAKRRELEEVRDKKMGVRFKRKVEKGVDKIRGLVHKKRD